MTDFSKLFTDPSAEVYGADETENAMWQQSSTNPFAVLHAIAARRNANNRRDQYGQQLAAHDARAQAGASALSRQEYQQNIPLEYIKRGDLDPSFGMDLAGLRMSNGEVDPRIRRQSHAFQAGQSADALKTHAEGVKAYGEAGYQLQDPGRLPDKYLNLSDLVEAPTLAEREQDARGRNDARFPFEKNTTEPRVDANGNMITYKEKFRTREELFGGPAPTAPPKPTTKTNGGAKPAAAAAPPATTSRNAPGQAPAQITPGKLTAAAVAERPPEQMNTLTKLKRSGIPTSNGTFMFVPNSLEIDEEGNVTAVFRLQANGKVVETIAQVAPDGQYRTN